MYGFNRVPLITLPGLGATLWGFEFPLRHIEGADVAVYLEGQLQVDITPRYRILSTKRRRASDSWWPLLKSRFLSFDPEDCASVEYKVSLMDNLPLYEQEVELRIRWFF